MIEEISKEILKKLPRSYQIFYEFYQDVKKEKKGKEGLQKKKLKFKEE
jgi:hypothetical protein